MRKKIVAIMSLMLLLIGTFATAAIPDTLTFKIENSTDTIFTVDVKGHVNATGNIQTNQDLYIGGTLVCTNCIGDEDVSNTLTASDLIAGANVDIGSWKLTAETFESDVASGTAPLVVASTTRVANLNASYAGTAYDLVAATSVVSDAEVDNDLTLSGGSIALSTMTYTGNLGWGNLTLYDLNSVWTNTLGYANITPCSSGEILKTNGGVWACAADADTTIADTNATTECAADQYLQGDGTCVDVTNCAAGSFLRYTTADNTWHCEVDQTGAAADVYVNETGDTMTGNLVMEANVTMKNSSTYIVAAANTGAFYYFDDNGGLVIHLEA